MSHSRELLSVTWLKALACDRLSLAELLSSLEASLAHFAGTSDRLVQHISRIDAYMHSAVDFPFRIDPPTIEGHRGSARDYRNPDVQGSRSVSVHYPVRLFFFSPLSGQLLTPLRSLKGIEAYSSEQSVVPQAQTIVSFPNQQPSMPELDSTLFLSDELVAEWPFDLGQGPIFDALFGSRPASANLSNNLRGWQQS